MNNMIKQMRIIEAEDECEANPLVISSPPLFDGLVSSSVFDSHIAFMERKKLVEQGRKKRVKVL